MAKKKDENMMRIRIISGVVVDGENKDPGEEVEVPVNIGHRLIGFNQAEKIEDDETEDDETGAGGDGGDETVQQRRKRAR